MILMPETAEEATVPENQIVPDPTLVAARDVARQALEEITAASSIGEPAGHEVHEERVVTLFFDCLLAGYPGWRWAATLSRVESTDPVNVLEVELLPGENAVVAPEWVPWSERLAQFREHQAQIAAEEAEAAEAEAAEAAADELSDEDDSEDSVLDNDYSEFDVDIDGVDVDDDDSDSDSDSDDDSDDDDDDDDFDADEDDDAVAEDVDSDEDSDDEDVDDEPVTLTSLFADDDDSDDDDSDDESDDDDAEDSEEE